MKYTVLADLHIKNWSDTKYKDNMPLKLYEILNGVKQALEYSVNNNISKVVIAGDINDLKNIVHYDAFLQFKKLIEQYNDKLEFIIISGNHDESASESSSSAIELFSGLKNIKTVVKNDYEEGNVLFVPWNHHIKDKLKSLEKKKWDILISHFGLTEALLVSDLSIVSPISLRDLNKFKLVILGHYHRPQNIGHIWYVGSPIQLRRSEKNEEKRFIVFDSETLTVESIPITGYRKYFEFIVDKNTNKEDIIKQANEYIKEGHYVTIKDSIGIFSEEEEYDGIVIVDNTEIDNQNRGITLNMTIEEQSKKWLEIKEIPVEEHDEYLKIGIDAIHK